ncbi:hypothetical protein EOM09_03820 [bacterium]|nr:hypothetical protein [bacterium]
MIITDKTMAILEYEKAQGYENGIPEADEGIYEVLFLFDRKGFVTKEDIIEIASKYGKEKDYKSLKPEEITEEKLKEILGKAEKIDQEIVLERNGR